jgi:Pyridoxamine 5'-phosphate oxidase
MFETTEELAALDALLAASFEGAGDHLTGIISPTRRLGAAELCRYLTGVKHLVVSTVTARCEPRCSAVDGLFLHGSFWFSTSATARKAQHLERRSAVSAAHVVGDDVGVFVHGRARVVHGGTDAAAAISHYWSDVYSGGTPEDWVPTPADARYVEVVATSMFTYVFNRDRFASMLATGDDAAG